MVGGLDAIYYAPTLDDGFVPATDLTPQRAQAFMPLVVYSLLALVQEFLPHKTCHDGFTLAPRSLDD